jgi:hypothetical protein
MEAELSKKIYQIAIISDGDGGLKYVGPLDAEVDTYNLQTEVQREGGTYIAVDLIDPESEYPGFKYEDEDEDEGDEEQAA